MNQEITTNLYRCIAAGVAVCKESECGCNDMVGISDCGVCIGFSGNFIYVAGK